MYIYNTCIFHLRYWWDSNVIPRFCKIFEFFLFILIRVKNELQIYFLFNFAQNNPFTKFDSFTSNISVYEHANRPTFALKDSFFTLIKMKEKVLKNSKARNKV